MNVTRRFCLIRITAWLAIGAALLALFFWMGRRQKDASLQEQTRSVEAKESVAGAEGEMYKIDHVYPVMGTFARITLFSEDKTALESAANKIAGVFNRIQKMGSLYDENSELSRLNAAADQAPFACSDELYSILKSAKGGYELSGGLFDISAKPLMDLWGFYRKRGGGAPSDEELASALAKVGFDKVEFSDADKSVRFKVPGMALDLGGIAKGYAVDAAFSEIDRATLRGGIINLGGNMRFFGDAGDGRRYYSIGVRHPRKQGQSIAVIELDHGGIATSGDYERFVEIDGKRYAHIINPVTGRPVEGMLSVTAVAESALFSDIASTAVFLGGEELAQKITSSDPEAFFVLYLRENDRLLRKSVGKTPPGGISYWDED